MIYCVNACALLLGGAQMEKDPRSHTKFRVQKIIDSKARNHNQSNQYLSVENDENAFFGNKASFPEKCVELYTQGRSQSTVSGEKHENNFHFSDRQYTYQRKLTPP